MKPSAWVTILFTAAGIVSACSSGVSEHPPIETSGGTPTTGSGGSSPGGGGTSGTSNDAGFLVTGTDGSFVPEGGQCNSTNCGGCCNTLNQCQGGILNAACGVSGNPCQTCTTGLTCTNGTCE
jgi:hypothetical protein